MSEIPKPDREDIGEIEEMSVPWLEAQRAELQNRIRQLGPLRAITESIRNPHLSQESLGEIVTNWNTDHPEWAGAYVEEEFTATNGSTLKVRMDKDGNIKLAFESKKLRENK